MKKAMGLLFVVWFLLGGRDGLCQERTFTCSLIDNGNIKCDVSLNGYPLYMHQGNTNRVSYTGNISHAIKEGTNTLGLSIGGKIDMPSPPAEFFELQIREATIDPATKRVLSEMNRVVLSEATNTNVLFVVPQWPVKTLPWSGDPVVISQNDENAIHALVQRIVTGFKTKNLKQLRTVFRPRNEHYTQATGSNIASVEASQDEFYGTAFSEVDFEVHGVDRKGLTFTPLGGSRLVRVLLQGRDPIVIELNKADGSRLVLPLLVTKIGSEWQVVQ